VITDERERRGLIVVVENVPGVKEVHDHLVWVEPMSGTAFASPEDEAEGARHGIIRPCPIISACNLFACQMDR
jgi:hypothetical protein